MFSFISNRKTDLLNEIGSDKNFNSQNDAEISHVICINYMPLTTYYQNSRVVALLHKPKGENISVIFKTSFDSKTGCKKGYIRAVTLGLYELQSAIAPLLNMNENIQPEKLRSEIPINSIRKVAEAITDLYGDSILTQEYLNLVEFIESDYAELERTGSINFDIGALQACFTRINAWIGKALAEDEGIVDLLAFVEKITESQPWEIRYIPEISAINIITKDYNDLEHKLMEDMQLSEAQIQFDRYMLHANYELLSIYTLKRAKGYRNDEQSMFVHLPEFVPIAMKFWYVYNPLLDYHPVTHKRMWDTLSRRYKYIGNAEVVANVLDFRSNTLSEHYYEDFDPDNPEQGHVGRIYYGLCCDFNDLIKDIQSHAGQLFKYIVSPNEEAWVDNTLRYKTYLAEAVTLQALQAAHNVRPDEYYITTPSDSSCILYSTSSADSNDQLTDITCRDYLGSLRASDTLTGDKTNITLQAVAVLNTILSNMTRVNKNLTQALMATSKICDAINSADL